MESQNNEHFKRSQIVERNNIKYLFDNYFKKKNCSNLILTSCEEEDRNSFDALFISAITKTICLEYKRRDILLFHYSDCIVEYPKISKLYDYHRAGNVVLYIIEYNDYIAVWNLSEIFKREEPIYTLDHFFYSKLCTKNCDPKQYSRGERYKQVRGLKFHECIFFLTKDFQRISYIELLERFK